MNQSIEGDASDIERNSEKELRIKLPQEYSEKVAQPPTWRKKGEQWTDHFGREWVVREIGSTQE